MVTCKHCSTPNSLDSTFCKRCGTALPADDVQIALEKLNALISEGNTAFNEGRTEEAMAIAESACLSNPSSTSALSLKSLCHERRGELAEALECADLIVDLNPDSELDKIKRNQLRTKLSVSVQLATQQPDRRSALIGAVSAVILVVCVGIGLAKYSNRTATSKGESFLAQNGPGSSGNTVQSPVTNPITNTQQNQSVQQQRVQDPAQNDPTEQVSRLNLSRGNSGTLPRPGIGQDDLTTIGDTPINPPNPPSGIIAGGSGTSSVKLPTPITAASPEKSTGIDDPTPKADDTHSASAQTTDPGLVEIKISGGHKSSGGGSESFGSGGAAALDKIGIQRYQLGSYGSAAASFEQALRAGGDQVTLNQWLGRCYGNLGKKSEQVDAYKRCVTACQTAISSGSGNKDRIKAILDTCQQELKVLQGN